MTILEETAEKFQEGNLRKFTKKTNFQIFPEKKRIVNDSKEEILESYKTQYLGEQKTLLRDSHKERLESF